MSVDYFLLEGGRAVPQEFADWQAAQDQWMKLALAVLSGDKSAEPDAVLACNVAAVLEARARAAFAEWCRT